MVTIRSDSQVAEIDFHQLFFPVVTTQKDYVRSVDAAHRWHGVGFVGSLLSGNVAIWAMVALLGVFQFSIAAAQIPMLPMIDTATNRALGEGNPGLAFGVFGAAWAAGTILGPLLVGPVFDIFGSWALALGGLAIPAGIALLITLKNRGMLHDCYETEIQKRKVNISQ